jgi:signal transduction histidine kinase/CheY-like chemotaxis protein
MPACVRLIPALLSWLLLAAPAWGGERGSPLVEVYDLQQMLGAHISTDFVQLADGRLCADNMRGLFRFDGARWELTGHPNSLGGMQYLSLGPEDRVYSSFDGDIGYWLDDATGVVTWYSVLGQVPSDLATVRDVRSIDYDWGRHGLWVGLQTQILFVPDDGTPAQVLDVGGEILFSALVGNEFLLQRSPSQSVSRVTIGAALALETVAGGELVSQQLWAATPGDGDWKIAATTGHVYSYRDRQLHPWVETAVPLLAQSDLRAFVHLRDGRYVIGTTSKGLLVLDGAGQFVDRYDDADGVPTNLRILGMLQDREGDLWFTGDRNISRIALSRGVTVYDEHRGLASALDAKRWRGTLYAGSPLGLFELQAEAGPGGGQFVQKLPQLHDVRSLAVVDDSTLLAASGQVHAISLDQNGELVSRMVAPTTQASVLQASRFVPGRAWVGHSGGVIRLDQHSDGHFEITQIADLNTAIFRLAEQDARSVWVADRLDGVTLFSVDGSWKPRHYGVDQGLPPGQVRIFAGAHQVWFTTTLGLRTYDPASDRFVVPAGLPTSLHQDRLFSVHEDAQGALWVRGGAIMNDVFWKTDDGWQADGSLLNAVDVHPTIADFMREGDIAWAIRATGLLRIDLANRTPLPPPPTPLLNQVFDQRAKSFIALSSLAALQPELRDLRFDFSLPVMHRSDATEYRSRLLGYDDSWSDWAGKDASRRVYTNLPDGEFTLEVEAKDSFWRVVAMPARTIRVLPPWWRSNWARTAYVLLALLALWSAARLGARRRQRQMLVRQHQLEAVVESRTLDLKRSNLQLAEQAERLAEVDRLKTRFFTNVGHEFRTPLTLVLGPLDDLMRDSRLRLGDRARELLELANRNARRVLDLIVELLDVNRLEQGQLPMKRENIDLISFLQRQKLDWQPLADRFGHQLQLHLPDLAALDLGCDPLQLERALGNLVGNAAKYTPRGGAITVSLQVDAEQAAITVADNGQGIAAHALPHVFDRFFQAEAEHVPQGTGIGLALVREIVEGHGGSVAVDSSPGQGSRFTLRLPRVSIEKCSEDTLAPPSENAELTDAPAEERPVALIIDDHADMRLRVKRLLEARFRVVEAEDGPSGLAAARQELPDIIVCDVMMPGFDGVELAKRVRADVDIAAVPLLLLTAKAGAEHAVTGLRAGADDYLSKPFDASELLARIDALLSIRRRLQRMPARDPAAVVAPANNEEQRFRQRLDSAIAARLGDSSFGVEELAQAMHSDRSTLFRHIKEFYGQSARDYLREARLKHAHDLLATQAGNVTEVAYASGFESLSSFSRAFRQRYTVSPSAVTAQQKAG